MADHCLNAGGGSRVSVEGSASTTVPSAKTPRLSAREDVVECKVDVLLRLLDKTSPSDAEVDEGLLSSRVNATAGKSSVESLFHAWFLTLLDTHFVGRAHAPAVNGILCSPRAREFATRRLFPDEIVCCDVAPVFIPYTDPELKLAQQIRKSTEAFIRMYQCPPRGVLLENHGLITLGKPPKACVRRC
jgi:rhamnose utilization protein RhaD (predicted bifunctional aldolase and dehydrogenase)